MAELTLYRVSAGGRIALEGVVDPGVEFYTATRDETGAITLTPVSVVSASARRTVQTHLVDE